jgi:hypothetical protein
VFPGDSENWQRENRQQQNRQEKEQATAKAKYGVLRSAQNDKHFGAAERMTSV